MNKSSIIRELLKRLHKTLGTMATRELAKYGLTVPQLVVLRTIMDQPMSIGQISKVVDLSYSTVSGIIDRLEREELVVRTRDEKDRRVVWISKTDKLVGLFAEVDLFIGDFYNRHFQGFSDDELNNIIHSLETFLEKIEEKES
jgi:MarR family transcriptional regulator, organic hydroperoxide resistance regulator